MGQNKKRTVKASAAKSPVGKQDPRKAAGHAAVGKAQAAAKVAAKPVKVAAKAPVAKRAPVKTAPVKATATAAPKGIVKSAKPAVVAKQATGANRISAASAKAKDPVRAVVPPKAHPPVSVRPGTPAAPSTAPRAAIAVPAAAPQRVMPAAVAKLAGSMITSPATPKDLAQKAATAHQAIAAAAAKKPVSQRHGFKTNEWIVYPAHGVGRIVAIEEQEIAGMALELFVIQFEKDKMTLRVPTGKSQSVGMRKLADDGVVKRAIDTLKGRARIKRTMWSRRAQEFETKINSGDLVSIAEVVRDLFRAENQPEQSYSERQLYEAALDRMAREIAAVEKLDDRGAVQRITEVLSKSAKGRRAAAEDGEGGEVKAA
jgi:CarD family transcriptional regulator